MTISILQMITIKSGSAAGTVWRIGAERARGGTSVVHEATGPSGEPAVLKILSGHRFTIDAAMRERFLREANALMRVSHQHALRILGTAEVDGAPALLLEMANNTLRDVARSGGPWPSWLVMRWIREALLGLSAFHALGTTHRDVSLKNLLIGMDGRVLVSDLGASIHVDDMTVTHASDRLGSLLYISGEQFSGAHGAMPADDIFSVGQVAWELFVGRPPIGNPPPLAAARPDVPPSIAAFVETLRSHERDRRPANGAEALQALDRALAEVHQQQGTRDADALAAIWLGRQITRAGQYTASLPGEAAASLGALVSGVGPVRLAVYSWSALAPDSAARISIGAGDQTCRRDIAVLLATGSARFHSDLIQAAGFTWTNVWLHNRLSGRGILVRGFDEELPIDSLDALRSLAAPVLDAFADRAFMVGAACSACGAPVHLRVRTDLPAGGGQTPWPIHRGATCPNEPPASQWRCALCGDAFRRVHNFDEHGRYDAVGCGCRGYAFDVEFDSSPWQQGSREMEPRDLVLLERHPAAFDGDLLEVEVR